MKKKRKENHLFQESPKESDNLKINQAKSWSKFLGDQTQIQLKLVHLRIIKSF